MTEMSMRGRIVILAAAVGMFLGALRRQEMLTLLSLSVLMWMLVAWCIFMVRVAWTRRHLECHRVINGRAGGKVVLWEGRPAHVRVTLRMRKGVLPAMMEIRDLVPENLHLLTGLPAARVYDNSAAAEIAYRCRPRSAGHVPFAGVQLTFHQPQGFWIGHYVHRDERRLRVLPSFDVVADVRPTVKRTNSLPNHGIHRLQRAGFGSELLELTEYQPGDPPKSIAWKVSARRNQLMTRQYESEVPVRVTMILQGSEAMRAGGFGFRMLDQSNFFAASIARAAVSVGDSVGITAVDSDLGIRRRMRPGNGDRAFYQCLEVLADFAAEGAPARGTLTEELLEAALIAARQRHPELMDRRINRPPLALLTRSPRRRRLWRGRHQLAMVLGEIWGLSTRDTVALMYDDRAMARRARRLLSDIGWAWMPPLVDQSVLAATAPANTLAPVARELQHAVAHARDNEVFVLFCHLIDTDPAVVQRGMEEILPSVKLAVARHHRVVFVLPTFHLGGERTELRAEPTVHQLYRRADEILLAEAADRVRRRMRGVGAAVGIAGQKNVVSLVMAEAELAGTGRYNRRGANA